VIQGSRASLDQKVQLVRLDLQVRLEHSAKEVSLEVWDSLAQPDFLEPLELPAHPEIEAS